MTLFWVDHGRQIKRSYDDFFSDARHVRTCSTNVLEKDPYQIFLRIFHSLAIESSLDILDSRLSEREVRELGIETIDTAPCEPSRILDFVELKQLFAQALSDENFNWRLGLYSSGTSGRPKLVRHQFRTLTRNVRSGERYKENIWGFAYDPTHIAGIQVLFQALFNQNPMINLFDQAWEVVPKLIEEYGITHISATPTFWRGILPAISQPMMTVEKISCGGERFDPKLAERLQASFPKASIRNIYASTETGSLFQSNGDAFTIPADLSELCRISPTGELQIHRSLLGSSPFNLVDEHWYSTGDIVEMTGPNTFRICSRESEIIKVGGYQVNPNEVEEFICGIEGVAEVVIVPRPNSLTGNILIAEVVPVASNRDQTDRLLEHINQQVRESLQPWKRPRIINFVDQISVTRTGKKKRL
jgi:acyl-coenzyme A synthetase/AMP-(fatty) acid ligase